MGVKLQKYYDLVKEKAGLKGTMRLAMQTGISSKRAMEEPDSPVNLKKFADSATEILGSTPNI